MVVLAALPELQVSAKIRSTGCPTRREAALLRKRCRVPKPTADDGQSGVVGSRSRLHATLECGLAGRCPRCAGRALQAPQTAMNGEGNGTVLRRQDMFAFLIDPLGWIEIDGDAFAPCFLPSGTANWRPSLVSADVLKFRKCVRITSSGCRRGRGISEAHGQRQGWPDRDLPTGGWRLSL